MANAPSPDGIVPPPPTWRDGLYAGLIILAGCCAYSGSFHGLFVFDDVQSIPENPDIHHLWPLGRVLGSTRTATVIGRPLLSLSLAVSYALHGTEVRGYHVFSLGVHLLAAGVLFRLLRRLCYLPHAPPEWRSGATSRAAAIALLWVVHPLASSAVLYIVQRAELLAGLAYLVALYALVRSAHSSRPGWWQALAVVACAGGMATKETVATAPLALLLLDRLLLTRSWRELWNHRKLMYGGLLCTWGELAVCLWWSQGRKGSAGFSSEMSSWHYLLTQCEALVTYVRLTAWPAPLVFDYGFSVAPSLSAVAWQAACVGGWLLLTGWLFWKYPRAALPGVLFFLILGPTSSVIPLITHTIAEHRMYLPLAALLAGAVWLINSFLADKFSAVALQGVTLLLALMGGVLTWQRAEDYATPLRLWSDTVNKRPQNARAHGNLGKFLADAGDYEAAEVQFRAALALQPRGVEQDPNRNVFAEAYGNLGNLELRRNRWAEAIAQLETAARINPLSARYPLLRAQARGRAGDFSGALADSTRAAEIDPASTDAREQKILALIQLQRFREARREWQHLEELGGTLHPALQQQLLSLPPEIPRDQ